MLDLRENRGAALPHLRRIPLHNTQIGPHDLRKISLVHNQQVRPRDAGAALARHLVSASNVDHVDDEIRQLARVVRGQVVAAGLDEEEVGLELLVQRLQGEQVGADVLADGGVRAAACFDGADARGGQGFVPG